MLRFDQPVQDTHPVWEPEQHPVVHVELQGTQPAVVKAYPWAQVVHVAIVPPVQTLQFVTQVVQAVIGLPVA